MSNMNEESKIPLQSKVFGHRFKPSQTIYEYLLEFLSVARAKKVAEDDDGYKDMFGVKKYKYIYDKEETFPLEVKNSDEMRFQPNVNIALKRFIFFENSKIEKRLEIDRIAYERHKELIKENMDISEIENLLTDKENAISIIQNLLYSFSAITQNRGWFAQNLLPICDSVIMTESMLSNKKNLKGIKEINDDSVPYIDKHFESNKYNFMCRGGEVYYSHLLSAINNHREFKECIEYGINKMITEFTEFEKLCNYIQNIWQEDISLEYPREGKSEGYIPFEVNKKLGYIPDGFKYRELYTLKEIKNILIADMHPFEKIDIWAIGMIFQIIIMTSIQADLIQDVENLGYLVFDVDCYKGKSTSEVKKFASSNYNTYNSKITSALAVALTKFEDDFSRNDKNGKEKIDADVLRDAFNDSVKVYKKLGKEIGIVRPLNEISIRFTLNEKILKFLVLSLVKPGTKMTFDRFLDKLFEHFRIVIGKDELLKADPNINEASVVFLENNKTAMQVMLKECGFLRELSDSTSIVENPYMEV